jgi:hypothetical protein
MHHNAVFTNRVFQRSSDALLESSRNLLDAQPSGDRPDSARSAPPTQAIPFSILEGKKQSRGPLPPIAVEPRLRVSFQETTQPENKEEHSKGIDVLRNRKRSGIVPVGKRVWIKASEDEDEEEDMYQNVNRYVDHRLQEPTSPATATVTEIFDLNDAGKESSKDSERRKNWHIEWLDSERQFMKQTQEYNRQRAEPTQRSQSFFRIPDRRMSDCNGKGKSLSIDSPMPPMTRKRGSFLRNFGFKFNLDKLRRIRAKSDPPQPTSNVDALGIRKTVTTERTVSEANSPNDPTTPAMLTKTPRSLSWIHGFR